MQWLQCDYDGTGLLGIPFAYVTDIIPLLISEDNAKMENASSRG